LVKISIGRSPGSVNYHEGFAAKLADDCLGEKPRKRMTLSS
jgi:hypothetical protein